MTSQRAKEFVYNQNHRFDKKTNQIVAKRNQNVAIAEVRGYDED
jgi:hypothetical protein